MEKVNDEQEETEQNLENQIKNLQKKLDNLRKKHKENNINKTHDKNDLMQGRFLENETKIVTNEQPKDELTKGILDLLDEKINS